MSNFKLGDKVRAKHNAPYGITTNGWVGEVVKICDDGHIIVFGKYATGKKKDGCGFTVAPKYFEKVCDNKIVITTDGVTTTARLYNGKSVIKTATAKCAPDDTFDFQIGAKIAFDRLTGFINPTLESTFDWDAFKNEKTCVLVNEKNVNDFRAEAKKHGLIFKDDENFDPFDSVNKTLGEMIRCFSSGCCKEDEIYITVKDNYLKFSVSVPQGHKAVTW